MQALARKESCYPTAAPDLFNAWIGESSSTKRLVAYFSQRPAQETIARREAASSGKPSVVTDRLTRLPDAVHARSQGRGAHLIRNEQINLRSGDGFRGCQSAEEVLAKIRDELGPEAASALRRFNRAIERQGQESRFCGNDCDVSDIGPDGTNR